MMILMNTIITVIILGAGFYLWRKRPSPLWRTAVGALSVAACAILWLVVSTPNAPTNPVGTDDPSQSQSQKMVTGPESGTTAPSASTVQPAPGNPTAQASVSKRPRGDVNDAAAPASNAIATTDEATEPASVVAKVNDEQLDELIGDAIPVKPEGSTMVAAVVKKGKIQKAERNSPSEDDYSFPQVVQGPGGMTVIIPDEPLPSVSSRRQLTTSDDEVPASGEVVALTYDMFSWSTGQMIESSQTALNGPLMYRLGGKETPIGIPEYLDEAIRDRPYGSTVQVVFEKEMNDLPGYMDPNDGYVLLVRVDKPEMDGDSALEQMMDTAANQ